MIGIIIYYIFKISDDGGKTKLGQNLIGCWELNQEHCKQIA